MALSIFALFWDLVGDLIMFFGRSWLMRRVLKNRS